MGEAHLPESEEGGAEIGATVKRAAAAIDDETGVFGKRCGVFLQRGDALDGGTRSRENGAGNVAAREKGADADVNDFEGRVGLGLKLFGEIGGRDCFGGIPRVSVGESDGRRARRRVRCGKVGGGKKHRE